MSPRVGTRLGPYEVTALLGEGGMGKVWRAHHTALRRDDALKVLPDAFASDPDRLARFRREAQVLASLNHPNIAHVYGLEQSDGVQALVMELVEGPTLADRIAQGPIPVDESLPIAKQIAEALEAAHEQGIIHRDLKPANIKVRADGTVKVLDFGLAKALEPASVAGVDATASPTITSPAMMTGVGVLLGTAAYMSPEQARGKVVDKRTDIWAFGCVLYEMLTGKCAFGGEDVTDTLASVVRAEPKLESVPANLRRLLRSCLEKDPRKRLRDVGDVWHLLDAEQSAPLAAARRGRVLSSLAVVASVAVVALSFQLWNRPSSAPATTRLSIALPPGQEISSPPAISPIGRIIAYTAQRRADAPELYVRTLNAFESKVIQESVGAQQPFFSPDGRWVAFFARGQLYKAEISGGAPVRIADAPQPFGGTWQEDDTIIYTAGISSGLMRVSANGGTPESLTKPDGAALGYGHVWPQALPGGLVLFTVWGSPRRGYSVLSLDSRRWNVVVTGDSTSLFAPSQRRASGYLLVRDLGAGVRAAALDPSRPVRPASNRAVLDGVYFYEGGEQPFLSVSKIGTAVYAAGDPTKRSVAWVDRLGQTTPLGSEQGFYSAVAVAPDGQRAVIKDRDLWVLDLLRGNRRRLTFEEPLTPFSPVWSRDGTRIVFSSQRGGNFDLYSQPVDASLPAEVLLERPNDQFTNSVTPDGSVIYTEQHPVTGNDLWKLAPDGKPAPLRVTPRNEGGGTVSPDGRWLAYMSDESGRSEVYVQRYPDAASTTAVSAGGGAYPKWSQDSRELFYVGGEAIMVASMAPDGSFGAPRRLFDHSSFMFDFRQPYIRTPYDISLDGKRLLMIHRDEGSVPRQLNVILNWSEELDRLVSGENE